MVADRRDRRTSISKEDESNQRVGTPQARATKTNLLRDRQNGLGLANDAAHQDFSIRNSFSSVLVRRITGMFFHVTTILAIWMW